MMVIHTPEEADRNRRYKALQFGGQKYSKRWNWGGNYGALFSPDGWRWTYYEGNPVVINAHEVNQTLFFDRRTKRYYCFPKQIAKSGRWMRRSVGRAWSEDFLAWSPTWTVLVPDEKDDELARHRVPPFRPLLKFDQGEEHYNAQFYGMTVFPYEGIYLGLLDVFCASGWPATTEPAKGGENGPVITELTSSRDLLNWQRAGDRATVVEPGAIGSWEQGAVYSVHAPVVVHDQIRIYYGGSSDPHSIATSGFPRCAIGLATLRLDGWVSVDADEQEGTLTTKLMRPDGTRLLLNAEATRGVIRAEICDSGGQALPGFTRGDCDPFAGDNLRHAMTWRGKTDFNHLQGQPIRLRFYLQRAKLYSFAFRTGSG